MAVASVLERQVNTTNTELPLKSAQEARRQEDELHNAQIRENFARIINPEFKREEIARFQNPSVYPIENVATAAPVQQAVQAEQPLYTPQMPSVSFNARSDATIFRADNPVNAVKDQAVAASAANFVQPVTPFEEEENEDLIPTMTTRQYRSRQAKEKEQEKSKGFTLSKKEKVIVGCFIGLVVLLFTVIIINSAIISGLNSGIGKLQNTYEAMEENYQQLTEELNDAQQPESILAKAEEWHLLP